MISEFATPPDWKSVVAANQTFKVNLEELKRIGTSWEKREPIKAAYLHGMIEMLAFKGVREISYGSMDEYIDMSTKQRIALMKAILNIREQKEMIE